MKTPADLSDKDTSIAALLERVEALVGENARLAARAVELEAKFGLPPKTPDNSSLPPSKGHKPSLPSVPKRKAKPHPGAHRLLHPNRPVSSPRRAGVLMPGLRCRHVGRRAEPVRGYDRVEIPAIAPDVKRVSGIIKFQTL